jgi:copper(I)-binding protein
LNKYYWGAFLLLLGVGQAFAAEVNVTDAWIRATAPGQDSAAVAMHITTQKDASIVKVSSPVSGHVEMHSMTQENGMMKMRELDRFELKAQQDVALGNKGTHIMLVGLTKPLVAGETVKIALIFQFSDKHKEKIVVNAEIVPLTETYDEHMHHH